MAQSFNLKDTGTLSWTADTKITGLADGGLSVSAGTSIYFDTASGNGMMIDADGNVGIGTADPEKILHINVNGHNGILVQNSSSQDTYATTLLDLLDDGQDQIIGPGGSGVGDGKIIWYYKDKTGSYTKYKCVITGATYFTGQHSSYSGISTIKTDSNLNDYVGLIVKSIGKYCTDESDSCISGVMINDAWPVFRIADTDTDKSVYGVITNYKNTNALNEPDNLNDGFSNWLDGKIRINSVGEGAIWVSNKNGNFENGDYITSSVVTGYGGKQSDDFLHNYTVAKITCDCDFDLTKVIKQKIKLVDDLTGKVISFDSTETIEYEDILDPGGNQQTVYKYDTRFLQADGTLLVDEADYETRLNNGEAVYIACFVGCTYHCG